MLAGKGSIHVAQPSAVPELLAPRRSGAGKLGEWAADSVFLMLTKSRKTKLARDYEPIDTL